MVRITDSDLSYDSAVFCYSLDMCASQSGGLFSLSTEDSTEEVLIPNRKILQEKKSQVHPGYCYY